MARTKVVATLGPASRDRAVLTAMIEAGVTVVRINCSHGRREDHVADVALVRSVAEELGRHVAILVDLQGPKMRVGTLPASGVVLAGEVTLRAGSDATYDDAIPVAYAHFADDVHPGACVLLDDGRIELRVVAVTGRDVRAAVVRGGRLTSNKGVNLPGVAVTAQSPTLKDLQDAAAMVEAGVDYLALSFVRSAEDVRRLRSAVEGLGSSVPIVAKLERPEALDHLGSILDVADAVMVARGDLGVEMGPERVPVLQKTIIGAANAHAIPVITATEMLESMVDQTRPTRAEASDVANAVFDGTSAVMLSAETAVGHDPANVVRWMVRICETAEAAPRFAVPPPDVHDVVAPAHAVAHNVVQMVRDLGAAAVVVHTQTGASSRLVASFRPDVPVLALSPVEATVRLVGLHRGVLGAVVAPVEDSVGLVAQANAEVVRAGLAKEGDTVVVVAGAPGQVGGTNQLLVHRVTE
ncbi:MAG: pyruvate kinase [Frankiaceae bacterium]|jgi:pyruvate kinase|nr:pyruvate kinase [Frankiaceae bacterium]